MNPDVCHGWFGIFKARRVEVRSDHDLKDNRRFKLKLNDSYSSCTFTSVETWRVRGMYLLNLSNWKESDEYTWNTEGSSGHVKEVLRKLGPCERSSAEVVVSQRSSHTLLAKSNFKESPCWAVTRVQHKTNTGEMTSFLLHNMCGVMCIGYKENLRTFCQA